MAELNELRDGEVETLAMKITTLEETIECLQKSDVGGSADTPRTELPTLDSKEVRNEELIAELEMQKENLTEAVSNCSRMTTRLEASEKLATDLRNENAAIKEDLISLRTEATIEREKYERELAVSKEAMDKLSDENNLLVQNNTTKLSTNSPMSRSMMEELGIAEDITQSPPHEDVVVEDVVEYAQKDVTNVEVQTVESFTLADPPTNTSTNIEDRLLHADPVYIPEYEKIKCDLDIKIDEIVDLKRQIGELERQLATEKESLQSLTEHSETEDLG